MSFLELRVAFNINNVARNIKIRENMSIGEFMKQNPGMGPAVLSHKSRLPPSLRRWATQEDRRRQSREEKKWTARKLDQQSGLKCKANDPSDNITVSEGKAIPSIRYLPPLRFSPANRSHSRRLAQIDTQEKRYNVAMEKYLAMKRKAELEKIKIYRQTLRLPLTTTTATPTSAYEQFATVYNNLFAYGPQISNALAALKQAQNDAHNFSSAAADLVVRLREVANHLKQLTESFIANDVLSGPAGLGWDWQNMHWIIDFIQKQRELAISVQAQLPESAATLLECLVEVTKLVGSNSDIAMDELDAQVLDQSFEEARSKHSLAKSVTKSQAPVARQTAAPKEAAVPKEAPAPKANNMFANLQTHFKSEQRKRF
jgi:hypothetical protein